MPGRTPATRDSDVPNVLAGDRPWVLRGAGQPEQPVYLPLRQRSLRLARRDDEVRGQLDLGQELGIFQRHVELVVHDVATSRQVSRLSCNACLIALSSLTDGLRSTHSHFGQTQRPR